MDSFVEGKTEGWEFLKGGGGAELRALQEHRKASSRAGHWRKE